MKVVERELPRLDGGQLLFTKNVTREKLTELVRNERLPSIDENSPTDQSAVENVKQLYEAMGIPQPAEWSSLAVRTNLTMSVGDSAVLDGYGKIVLVVRPEVVASELLVFNGDTKGLAAWLRWELDEYPDRTPAEVIGRILRWLPSPDDMASITGLADLMVSNKREHERVKHTAIWPRLLGSYVEARLTRALVPTDIDIVYLQYNCGLTLTSAKELLAPWLDEGIAG